MKTPGEMTAEELLDIIAGVPTLERNQAKAELLARLNAGGSPEAEAVIAHERQRAVEICDLTLERMIDREICARAIRNPESPYHSRRKREQIGNIEGEVFPDWGHPPGASQPLQPRCPNCHKGTSLVLRDYEDGLRLTCGANCGLIVDVDAATGLEFSLSKFAQFFRLSAPPAMPAPASQCSVTELGMGMQCLTHHKTFPWGQQCPDKLSASPQLEQVAREAAKEIFAKVFSFDPIRAEKIEKIILKWMRHFPGSEGAAKNVWNWPVSVPESEFSAEFIQYMANRMATSFYKYGAMASAYPHKISALESLKQRLDEYRKTANTEFLVDAANFCLIEFMRPSIAGAAFTATDSSQSPGRTLNTGMISSQPNCAAPLTPRKEKE